MKLNLLTLHVIYLLLKMKKTILYAAVLACCWQTACTEKKKETTAVVQEEPQTVAFSFKAVNPTEMERIDEGVVLSREELAAFGDITKGVPVLTAPNGQIILSQLDDINDDGQWDELAFVHTFAPNETVEVKVEMAQKAPEMMARTQVRFAKNKNTDQNPIEGQLLTEETKTDRKWQDNQVYYQAEGPVWENDKVAFRHYFDERNGVDIFGKTTDSLVADRMGYDTKNASYHELQPWGMDILKVAGSLGAGALAIETKDGKLHRLSKTAKSSYKQIASGPARAIFRLNYEGWQLPGGNTIGLEQQISLWAGHYWYQSQVKLNGIKGKRHLVAGITTVKLTDRDPLFFRVNNEEYVSIATHARQSEAHNAASKDEPHDFLGMGILVPKNMYAGKASAPKKGEGNDVTTTYYVKLEAEPEKEVVYYFFAGWAYGNKSFSDAETFLELIDDQADRLDTPIEIQK